MNEATNTKCDLDFFNFWIKPESDYSVKIVNKFRIKKERFLKENGAIESNNDHCFFVSMVNNDYGVVVVVVVVFIIVVAYHTFI